MNIKEALENAIKELKKSNIEDSTIIAKVLLSYTLNKDKQYLLINAEKNINQKEIELFNSYLKKIIEGYPLQYITHKQEFMNICLYVDENVLIPQPDTEILVEEVIKICKNKKTKILDLCTGSGAIAIALKRETNAELVASDISSKALEIAEKNSNENKTDVKFIQSDLFEKINQKFNIIVSNPPYIKTDIIPQLSKQVQNEPHIALDGGIDGLNIYRRIIDEAYKFIEDGYLCLEIGYDQKNDVINLIKCNENYTDIYTKKDLSGNDRCIIAKVKGE